MEFMMDYSHMFDEATELQRYFISAIGPRNP